MPALPGPADRVLEQYRAFLECLTFIQVDPRLWRRFGWSDIVNHTLLEAYGELELLQGMDEPARNRRLQRMLKNNLLERIAHEQAQIRDVRREVSLDEALRGSSCNLQKWLVADDTSPSGQVEALEQGARLAHA